MTNRLRPIVMAVLVIALTSLATGCSKDHSISSPTGPSTIAYAETASLPTAALRQFVIQNSREFGGLNVRWPDGKLVRVKGYAGMPAGALDKMIKFRNDHIPASSGVRYQAVTSGDADIEVLNQTFPGLPEGCGTVVRQIEGGKIIHLTIYLLYGKVTDGCDPSWEGRLVGTLTHEDGHGLGFGFTHPTESEMGWSIATTVPPGDTVADYVIPDTEELKAYFIWNYANPPGSVIR
jgi:hypothetical protein